MNKGYKVLILGNGRIGRAVLHYLKNEPLIERAAFLSREGEAKKCDLLIGALPGDLGEQPLRLAFRYRKNLIDISDVEPQVYAKKNREAIKSGITLIPCCGFCPGLINFILGRELAGEKDIKAIEIKAGTLSWQKDYFPFLWCFEDLVLEHRIPSWQILCGRVKKFPPFAGYRRERFFGIEAESYFAQSGFENMMQGIAVENFSFRVLRPLGFKGFFGFLESEGFLKKDRLAVTKGIVEENVKENITLAAIDIKSPAGRTAWLMKSVSGPKEKLNSMQKITAITPVAMAKALLSGRIKERGVLFPEVLGRDSFLFKEILRENNIRQVRVVKSERAKC